VPHMIIVPPYCRVIFMKMNKYVHSLND